MTAEAPEVKRRTKAFRSPASPWNKLASNIPPAPWPNSGGAMPKGSLSFDPEDRRRAIVDRLRSCDYFF